MLRITSMSCCALIIATASVFSTGQAQTIPYRATGVGTYSPVTGVYAGLGVGSPIGAHTFLGNVITSPTANPLVFDFSILPDDPQETVGANGDKIYFSGAGQVYLIPLDQTLTLYTAIWYGKFNVEGGTGQFANVAPGPAPLKVFAINKPFTFADPDWNFYWSLSGKITLKKPDRGKVFKISGEGVAPEGLPLPGQEARPHWAVGQATHLGHYDGEGAVQVDTANFNPDDNTFTGEFGSGVPFVFTGANGDQLVCNYGRTDLEPPALTPGTFTLTIVGEATSGQPMVEAEWIADFVPIPEACTGKFAGVKGGWVMYAYSDPFELGSSDPISYRWEGTGRLYFKNNGGRKR